MKIEKGQIIIEIEDIIKDEKTLIACAKYAVFNRTFFYGLIEILLKEEVDWNEIDGSEDLAWRVVSGFGKSFFERTRELIISKADEITQKTNELLKTERDTFEKYYEEYRAKFIQVEKQLKNISNEYRKLEEKYNSLKEGK